MPLPHVPRQGDLDGKFRPLHSSLRLLQDLAKLPRG